MFVIVRYYALLNRLQTAMEQYYTPEQIAEMLKLDPQFVYQYLRNRKHKEKGQSGQWLIHRTELHAFLKYYIQTKPNKELTHEEKRIVGDVFVDEFLRDLTPQEYERYRSYKYEDE